MNDDGQNGKFERAYGFDFHVEGSAATNPGHRCGVPGCKSDKCASHSVPMNYFGVMFDTDVCDDCLPRVSLKSVEKSADKAGDDKPKDQAA